MTDTLTEASPDQLRQHLAQLFAEPKISAYVVAAGLTMASREVARLHQALLTAESGTDQVVETIALLADEVRRGQRRYEGAVAEAQKAFARADLLERVLDVVMGAEPALVDHALRVAGQCPPYRRTDQAAEERLNRAYRAEHHRVRAGLDRIGGTQ